MSSCLHPSITLLKLTSRSHSHCASATQLVRTFRVSPGLGKLGTLDLALYTSSSWWCTVHLENLVTNMPTVC